MPILEASRMIYREEITFFLITRYHSSYVKAFYDLCKDKLGYYQGVVIGTEGDLETRQVCDSFPRTWRYIEAPKDSDADDKTKLALEVCKTEYCWPIGDGIIPDFDSLEKNVFTKLKTKFDVVHLLESNSRDTKIFSKKYFPEGYITSLDPVYIFENFFWSLTFMGSVILSKKLCLRILGSSIFEKNLGSGFALPIGLFSEFAQRPALCCCFLCHFYIPNPKKVESIWMKEGKIFEIWAKCMPESVRTLPKIYDDSKDLVIRTTCLRNNYFTLRGMIRWRAKGALNNETLSLYGKQLANTSSCNPSTLRVLGSLPIWCCILLNFPFVVRNYVKRHFLYYYDSIKKSGF
jgi:hypothetical protein